MEELYTQAEVAKMLKVGVSTISRWMRNGVIAYIKIGGSPRIEKSAIEDLIKRSRVKTASDMADEILRG